MNALLEQNLFVCRGLTTYLLNLVQNQGAAGERKGDNKPLHSHSTWMRA